VDGADDGPARVGYALGRALGSAVARNRVRRRLRAAVRQHEGELRPGCAYLFGAGRSAVTMPFEQLAATVGELVQATPSGPR
jgi:ribonuclease P protein component